MLTALTFVLMGTSSTGTGTCCFSAFLGAGPSPADFSPVAPWASNGVFKMLFLTFNTFSKALFSSSSSSSSLGEGLFSCPLLEPASGCNCSSSLLLLGGEKHSKRASIAGHRRARLPRREHTAGEHKRPPRRHHGPRTRSRAAEGARGARAGPGPAALTSIAGGPSYAPPAAPAPAAAPRLCPAPPTAPPPTAGRKPQAAWATSARSAPAPFGSVLAALHVAVAATPTKLSADSRGPYRPARTCGAGRVVSRGAGGPR